MGAVVAALVVGALFVAIPRLQPSTGTLLVIGAGRSATSLPTTTIELHGSAGWTALGQVSGEVPAAPAQRELLALPVAVGAYDGVRLGAEEASLPVVVTAGQVEPILLGIDSGKLIAGAAYAGNDQVNLGLGELSGRFVPMPAFNLKDQHGNAFDSQTTAGTDLVIAAFHTTCHETCPLYTALFFQLQKQLPPGVLLAEVTTDPATDTPAALDEYGRRIGAGWTFATGSPDALAAFWKPFGVELASGDSHVSTLALVDRHGYVRLVLVNEGDTAQLARDFLSATGIQQAALLDSDLKVGRAYGVLPLPTTVFVRADGTIAGRQIGELDERVLASWLSTLTTQ